MKTYLLSLLFMSSLFAGTYDDTYSPLDEKGTNINKSLDQFMYGDFAEILRFDAMSYSGGDFDSDSKKSFDDMVATIKNYISDGKEIKIKVIGHVGEDSDEDEAVQDSQGFAVDMATKLEDNNISKEIIYVENRGFKDPAYTSGTSEGVDLSNRVMVTMYVLPKKKVVEGDDDNDGVVNSKDKCPNTPEGVKVDEDGCCLDDDKDGVCNYMDDCPNTMQGLNVDEKGCPISMTVRDNFKTDSWELSSDGVENAHNFAKFLDENPAYKVKITGHTDSTGSEKHNMELSLKRATSLKDALVKDGIAEDRLTVEGKGESAPIETNKTKEGRAANRRIEVQLFY